MILARALFSWSFVFGNLFLNYRDRYLFNCGEGSQRLAHEHRFKIAKLEHIFITSTSWNNIGGLPGVALTIQDVGIPKISLHGPPGLVSISFVNRLKSRRV